MKTAIVAAFLLGFCGGCLLCVSLMYAHGSMLAEGGPR
jgi:hypothetical protein